ncbi:glycosyltransferase [Paenibacillus sp. PFR10]|uniref:Glycosyltransferase n=3 Tax=Paenibacillus TaxID=44249 RepID=A0ABU3RHC7_9BACL|nr:glycosyltransferase [Paenibacillus sp. PFR10]MDU0203695.1 glycosyltransferase [Paenibacillus sp. PFR10]
MNICLVSRELYPFQKAGIGVYIHNLIKALLMYGHKVYVITSEENRINYYRDLNNNTNVVVLGVEIGEKELIFEDYNYAYSFGVYNQLKRLIDENEINLVQFSDFFGEAFFSILYKKNRFEFNQVPFIVKLHAPTYECNVANHVEMPENLITQQEDYTINNAEFVCAISYFMKDTVAKRLQRTDIQVLYNIIDMPEYINLFELNVNQKYVLYVGRLQELKGVDLFVKAAVEYLRNNNDDISFVIIGQDMLNHRSNKMMKEELVEFIPKELQEKFIWKTPMPQEDLFNFYKNAYVSVFPSRFEGFGNVCVEAMQMGSPVIVSNDTGMLEIIDNENYGISFNNGDYFDLYKKITVLLEDKNLRDRYRSLSLVRAKDFSLANIYPTLINYYESVLEQFKNENLNNKENIIEHFSLKNIDRMKKFSTENKRIIKEWNKLAETNKLLIDEASKYNEENKRVLSEWEFGNKVNEELKNQNQNLIEENQRMNQQWEEKFQQYEIESNKIREDQQNEIGYLRKLAEEREQQLEFNNLELEKVIGLLKNKKFLIKQLMTWRKGKKL